MRLLIIEDELDLQRALQTFLQEDGYAVDVAQDGDDGLIKAQMWSYDAIILDVMLPKRNGWDVLQELRRSKKTPVLMLTARDQITDRIRGLDSGADDYLVKPFDLDELAARVRALIRRSVGVVHPVIEIGDLAVDTAAKEVRRADGPVHLTATEFSLVEYLALHRGEVVSRTRLYEHLFDEAEDSLSNLLDVHVSNIRRKLGHDVIVTRRGQGYLIND